MMQRKTTGSWLGLAAAAAGLAGAEPAAATPMSFGANLSFTAPTQSLWGPGGSTASFGVAGSTGDLDLVIARTGLRWDFGASSGTVGANVRGQLGASYDDSVARNAPTPIAVSFAPTTGSFATSLGAHADLSAYFEGLPLGIPDQSLCLFCQDYSLDAGRSFAPTLGTARSANDSFPAAGLGVSVVVAGVDASLNATQTATFRPDGVRGVLQATHAGSGATLTQSFALSAAMGTSVVDFAFDRNGLWDLRFVGLALDNTFWTSFGASLTASAWYNFLLASGSITIPIAALNLFNGPQFALGFGSLSTTSFSVSVPEPATLGLLAFGLVGLYASGRPRGRLAAS
jgi:hypothetical protein